MKKLISILPLTYRCCLSMRMTGEAKPSKGKAAESEISVSVIPVDKSKKEEKTFALSSAMAKLIVDTKEEEQNSGDEEKVEQKGSRTRSQ